MEKSLIEKVVDEARNEESKLVIWDRRDTFTIEHKDLGELELANDHLRVRMQDGRATVYVEYETIYKLVVEKERADHARTRTGFGAAS